MILTSTFPVKHVEPPAWVSAPMARWFLHGLVYRRFVGDLAAGVPPGATLLDVGAGPGYLLEALARKRPDLQALGLDIDYGMLRRGPASKQFTPVVGDAQALPFRAGAFHQVLATFSLHIWPHKAAGLREILRVLRPGGGVWLYEMQREAPAAALRAFARDLGLPSFLVYPAFKVLSWGHALTAAELTAIIREARGTRWRLSTAHHVFWRVQLEKG
ncbi:MAG: class I SAM-dependent methyltransferase [Deltaproteobacteria bacterium]|nr:class I SAM-dependent methyltransferase [Deltaproteobacteria bacterium]